ncbi:MAG TPA: hemerythrin domain-containing protein [Streptosporangiaceae bacterium]|nr:hemerythrin domain-containing protein [Streptosporangiaceae bacterium]
MTTNKLAGADAARHGTGDADLTVMLAAHEALRRDLTGLAHAAAAQATGAGRGDPGRQQAVQRGWAVFQRQLHIHHTAEDELVWPALRDRLAASDTARSVLDAMEAEHQQIDPLLAAVDRAMSQPGGDDGTMADTVDVLTMALHGHLAHEERDALPLIGTALTAAEWRAVGRTIGVRNLRQAPEMFAWMLDGAPPEQAAAAVGQLPPPARLLYRTVWRPRFTRRERW